MAEMPSRIKTLVYELQNLLQIHNGIDEKEYFSQCFHNSQQNLQISIQQAVWQNELTT